MVVGDAAFQVRSRRGQVLIEFAIIAMVVMLLLAGILTFGLLLHGANVIQQAADVGAMELARLPLPPTIEFPSLGGDPTKTSTDPYDPDLLWGYRSSNGSFPVKEQVFNERYLVVREAELGSQSFADYMANNAPLLNRLLAPVFVSETVSLGGSPEVIFRFPGAIVRNVNTGDLTVLIPVSTGPNSFEWRAAIEEIREDNDSGPLSLKSDVTNIDPGMVALRINYPFQSGAMLHYRYELNGQGASLDEVVGADGVEAFLVDADDSTVSIPMPPAPYSLIVPSNGVHDPGDNLVSNTANSGQHGLGRMYAYLGAIRPYRKVLIAQAIYRREVFAP